MSSQPQYSLLWRKPEKALIPLCAAEGISQIVWSPLAQGVLTGKVCAGPSAAGRGRATSEEMGGWMEWLLRDDTLAAVQRLKPLAAQAGLSLAQFALAWVLAGAERGERDRRRVAARAGRGQCGGVGGGGGSGAVRGGGEDRGRGLAGVPGVGEPSSCPAEAGIQTGVGLDPGLRRGDD